jgi:hypothetical protein
MSVTALLTALIPRMKHPVISVLPALDSHLLHPYPSHHLHCEILLLTVSIVAVNSAWRIVECVTASLTATMEQMKKIV